MFTVCYNGCMKPSRLIQGENERKQITISVRNLVEFLLRSGDIEEGQGMHDSLEAMQQGGKIHRKLQKKEGLSYHAEVPLKILISYEDYDLGLEGRADGIIYDEEDLESVVIDEIKGMYGDVTELAEPLEVHLAQAKCYAYVFASQNHLDRIGVRMTYCSLDTEEIQRFQNSFSVEELENWFGDLLEAYHPWADFQYQWNRTRQASISDVEFPFPYRKGQKKLVADVYRSILREKILFIQAPTGTGKTIATIFPAVKAVGEELADRIFYLTAKTATAAVAKDTFLLLAEQGYRGKTVLITAKDKICPMEERTCNPEQCPYAKGHYDRINEALYGLLQREDLLSREVLLAWAKEKMVCPFELSLDAASWADNIICDYNYAFDPNVYLKRFFAEGVRGDYLFLVDEAHNLVERAREMYSEHLKKEEFLEMKKLLKSFGKRPARNLERCSRIMLAWKRDCEKVLFLSDVDELVFAVMNVCTDIDELLRHNVLGEKKKTVQEFYFKLRNFLHLAEEADEHYRMYCDFGDDGGFWLHLFCVDPSRLLQERLDRGRATVFFSATLLPVNYYKELLCAKTDVYAIYAESVFDPGRRAICIASDVTSRYTRRSPEEYEKYAAYISRIVSCRNGNYMVFFPSYRFLEQVRECFQEDSSKAGDARGADTEVICQTSGMTEEEKEAFLEKFEEEREGTLVAFCVMGGVFSEGIDLVKEKLIGAILVGAGLPQIGNERDVMRRFFDERQRDGFAYAYLYPGMNKVIQGAGRVIRTAEDRGIIALLDERFLQSSYQRTFPREWSDYQICSLETVKEQMERFWNETDERERMKKDGANPAEKIL